MCGVPVAARNGVRCTLSVNLAPEPKSGTSRGLDYQRTQSWGPRPGTVAILERIWLGPTGRRVGEGFKALSIVILVHGHRQLLAHAILCTLPLAPAHPPMKTMVDAKDIMVPELEQGQSQRNEPQLVAIHYVDRRQSLHLIHKRPPGRQVVVCAPGCPYKYC